MTSHRLIETLDPINEFKADAGPIHLRPEIIYAHERHRKYSQVFPGRIARNILAYTVLPIDDDTPPLDDLIDGFIDDSLELYLIVTDALGGGHGHRLKKPFPSQNTPNGPRLSARSD